MAGTSCRATLGSIPHAWPWNCRNNVPGCLVLVCKVDESGDLREMYSALAWNDTWDDARMRTLLFYLRGARSLRIPASWRPLIGDLRPGPVRSKSPVSTLRHLFLRFQTPSGPCPDPVRTLSGPRPDPVQALSTLEAPVQTPAMWARLQIEACTANSRRVCPMPLKVTCKFTQRSRNMFLQRHLLAARGNVCCHVCIPACKHETWLM